MSSAAVKELLLFGDDAKTFAQFIADTAPVGWWKLNDASSPAVNSGSAGTAINMTGTSVTFQQTGKLGATDAVSLDGANSRLQTANNAALANPTTWEFAFLVNPNSAGESSQGKFFSWGNAFSDTIHHFEFGSGLTAVRTQIWNAAGSSFASSTTTGLTASTWAWVFCAYDDSGDRKAHLYKGISGVAAEYAYSLQVALTGTYKTPTQALNLFNTSNQTLTFDGLADEVLYWNRNLTANERTQITALSGV